MKKIKRRSRKQIRTHLAAQRQSGLPVTRYCAEHNISKQTFYMWRKRYEATSVPAKTTNDFVALRIEPSLNNDVLVPIAQLDHPNGCRISFYKGCTPLFLSQTIKHL